MFNLGEVHAHHQLLTPAGPTAYLKAKQSLCPGLFNLTCFRTPRHFHPDLAAGGAVHVTVHISTREISPDRA